jgi:hypothetical protein
VNNIYQRAAQHLYENPRPVDPVLVAKLLERIGDWVDAKLAMPSDVLMAAEAIARDDRFVAADQFKQERDQARGLLIMLCGTLAQSAARAEEAIARLDQLPPSSAVGTASRAYRSTVTLLRGLARETQPVIDSWGSG